MIDTLEITQTLIPWESRPNNCTDVVWRFSGNPVIQRNAIPSSNSIFNSAVVSFDNKFAGVFRCDDKARCPMLHAGFSNDGIKWEINPVHIAFTGAPDNDGIIKSWSVHYITRISGNEVCIIAVNTKGEMVNAAITSNGADGIYNVLSESRTVKVIDGKITDVFKPYATHIYCSFKTMPGKFAEVLKSYTLEDSSIGISGPENLANFWYGAKPTPSSTNKYHKSQSCEAIDGSFVSYWLSGTESDPYYEVKLYKKGHVRKIIYSSEEKFNKLEVYRQNKWENIEPSGMKEYYVYWDDDANQWKTADHAPAGFKSFPCVGISLDYTDVERVRIWGTKSIRELQVF